MAEAPNWDNSNEISEFGYGLKRTPGRSVPGVLFWQNEPNWDTSSAISNFAYSFASFGITSVENSCSDRSASASDMVPRKR